MAFFGLFSKEKKKENLDRGLEKTKEGIFSKIKRATMGRSRVDDDFLDELEEIFVTSDMGIDTTLKIIDRLKERVARDKYVGTDELNALLHDEISALLADTDSDADTDSHADADSYAYSHADAVYGTEGSCFRNHGSRESDQREKDYR